MAVSVSGRFARTQYEVLQEFSEPISCALVRCDLETGRTHQIRVHLGAIGHPVIGDGTYKGFREGLKFPRPALHAAVLAFEHPTTGDEMSFTAPLPSDFEKLLQLLEPEFVAVDLQ
jgi:23S rRNA pseudouridine1911/1915/1917 synthase